MLKYTLTYWAECDGTDCKSRCPHRDDDIASYNSKSYLDEALPEQDWRTLPGTAGFVDRYFCDRCWDSCEPCDGDGYADDSTLSKPVNCSHCDGRGWNPAGGGDRG